MATTKFDRREYYIAGIKNLVEPRRPFWLYDELCNELVDPFSCPMQCIYAFQFHVIDIVSICMDLGGWDMRVNIQG